ncbi:hypothetical protein [Lapidilactobacillus salsurivasis]
MRFSAPFRKAQSDAHSELTPNFAAQAAANIETCSQPPILAPHSVFVGICLFEMVIFT